MGGRCQPTAFTPRETLLHQEIPQRQVIATTLEGDYSLMAHATEAIGAYLAEHNLNTGPMFTIYRIGPGREPDPSKWVTDVCFPIIED